MSALRAGYPGNWDLMTQTFRACFVLLLVGCGLAVTACSSDETTDSVYENWAARNSAAFSDTLSMARTAIAQAKAQYGDAWTEHTLGACLATTHSAREENPQPMIVWWYVW